MDAPCKNCEKRYVGCHSNCSDYDGFRAERQKEIDARKHHLDTTYMGRKKSFSEMRRNHWRIKRTW